MRVAVRITIATAVVVTLVSSTYAILDLRGRARERRAALEVEATSLVTALRASIETSPRDAAGLTRLAAELSSATRGWTVAIVPRTAAAEASPGQRRRLDAMLRDPTLVLVDNDDGRLVCAAPLRWADPTLALGATPVVASLELARSLDVTEAAERDDQIQAALMVLFVVGLSTLAVAVISRGAVSRPIGKLLSGIDDVAKGDLSHVLLSEREDEIGQLATRFNEMTFSLRESRAETRKQNEATLQLEQRLGQTEKLATIGQLAAEIAHEVGTPLGVIAGRARATQRKATEPETVTKNATIIAEQTARITRIIQRLLDFSRRKVGHAPQRVRLDDLATTTLELLAGHFTGSKVRPRLERGAADAPLIVGDADRLQQVLINLVLNAVQAMPDGGELRVVTDAVTRTRPGLEDAPAQAFAILDVIDAGPGIPVELRDKVFDPFFTTKERHGGTGLGLAVCFGIVKEHDGWIELLDPASGVGTHVRVVLPAAPDGAAAAPPDALAEGPGLPGPRARTDG